MSERINKLISEMTIQEKIGQLNQLCGVLNPDEAEIATGGVGSFLFEIPSDWDAIDSGEKDFSWAPALNRIQRIAVQESRLGIPLLFCRDVIHGHRTIFPIPLAQAASWNEEIVEKLCEAAALEASADGIHLTFAPMIDIARDPRWGRIAESFGEDPYLCSLLGAASVRGYQGDDLSDKNRIAACAKHFVAYGAAEGGRDYNTADLSDRTLRETYLPPFLAAVKENVATFMTSFNEIGGVPMSCNPELVNGVLREEWGYQGTIISDWEAIKELRHHGVAADDKEAASLGIAGGVDIDMVARCYANHLEELVEAGELELSLIDSSVKRMLELKENLGLFDNPYMQEEAYSKSILLPETLELAKEAASSTFVLLKNSNETLPLNKDLQKLSVVGPLSNDRRSLFGTWVQDGRTKDTLSIAEALKSYTGKNTTVLSAEGSLDQAIHLANESKTVIAVVGEHYTRSGEANSVSDIGLPAGQLEFVRALRKRADKLITVLLTGRSLAIEELTELSDALLLAWHPGTEGAKAVAEVLFGDSEPGGRLPVTFPRSTGQIPIYYNHKSSGRPVDRDNFYTSKYIDIQNSPLFPFGFGLGYTSFEFSDLKLSSKTLKSGEKLTITVSARNTGSRPGQELVQLYIKDKVASVTRPVKELKGFKQITCDAGQSVDVELELDPKDLAFWGRENRWIIEPGEFEVMVGSNCEEFLSESFVLSE